MEAEIKWQMGSAYTWNQMDNYWERKSEGGKELWLGLTSTLKYLRFAAVDNYSCMIKGNDGRYGSGRETYDQKWSEVCTKSCRTGEGWIFLVWGSLRLCNHGLTQMEHDGLDWTVFLEMQDLNIDCNPSCLCLHRLL